MNEDIEKYDSFYNLFCTGGSSNHFNNVYK